MYILYKKKGKQKNNKNIVLQNAKKRGTAHGESSPDFPDCIIIQTLRRHR